MGIVTASAAEPKELFLSFKWNDISYSTLLHCTFILFFMHFVMHAFECICIHVEGSDGIRIKLLDCCVAVHFAR